MKVSIITAVLNGGAFIEDCILSVARQTWPDIEHIVIDGASSDNTVDIIKRHEQSISKWISAPDKGIYHALNKGLSMVSGEIVGFLHADDLYSSNRVIEMVASEMAEYNTDSCYGDLVYVKRYDPEMIIRYWRSCRYDSRLFDKGWMPPHPTFFVKREVYEKNGYFDPGFRIAADYELVLRFLKKIGISAHHIPEVLVRMRSGGASNRSLKNLIIKTREDYRAWKTNGLDRPFYTIPLKNLSKIPQFYKR